VTLPQRIILTVLKTLCRIFLSWEARGGKNVPPTGPLIVVANHVHLLDPILLALSFSRWISFMAKEELFRNPFLRPILRWAQVFVVRRQGTTAEKRQAIEQAQDMLNGGLVLGMFPEGKRSREGRLLPGKTGSAVIASQTGVLLLPVGIIGTDKIRGISWLWRHPHIIVNIGQPFRLPSFDGRLSKAQLDLLTTQVMSEIAALLPPEYQGAYSERTD
jgi:1-acyl-sn-glycerol-3-phosphate acyltransferase